MRERGINNLYLGRQGRVHNKNKNKNKTFSTERCENIKILFINKNVEYRSLNKIITTLPTSLIYLSVVSSRETQIWLSTVSSPSSVVSHGAYVSLSVDSTRVCMLSIFLREFPEELVLYLVERNVSRDESTTVRYWTGTFHMMLVVLKIFVSAWNFVLCYPSWNMS